MHVSCGSYALLLLLLSSLRLTFVASPCRHACRDAAGLPRCACAVAVALQAVVPLAASPDDELRGLCLDALGELLSAADSVGSSPVLKAALEAVQLLADLVSE